MGPSFLTTYFIHDNHCLLTPLTAVELSANMNYLRCRSAVALRCHCVLRRGQGLPPLSPHPFLRFRHCSSAALRRFFLTKPNTSCTIEMPASLRSDGVRDHPGMLFGIILDLAFGFAGIPSHS